MSNPCMPVGASHDLNTAEHEQLTLVGTGDTAACSQAIVSLLNTEQLCSYNECSFNGEYQPSVADLRFVAFSYFYDVLPEFVRPQVPDEPSLAEIRAAALQVLPSFLFSFPFFFPDHAHHPPASLRSSFVRSQERAGRDAQVKGSNCRVAARKGSAEAQALKGIVCATATGGRCARQTGATCSASTPTTRRTTPSSSAAPVRSCPLPTLPCQCRLGLRVLGVLVVLALGAPPACSQAPSALETRACNGHVSRM